MDSAGLDHLVEALLWERQITDSEGKSVNVYRMKVSKVL